MMNNIALAWIQTSELLPTAPSFISSNRSDEVSLTDVSPIKALEARLRMGMTSVRRTEGIFTKMFTNVDEIGTAL